MRLVKQIIEKKLELSSELMLNRNYLRSIWQFYCCYNLALSVLGKIEDIEITKKRNRLWRKLFVGKLDDKKFKKIQKFMQNDMNIIINALNLIEKQSEDMDFEMGSLDKTWAISVLSYEYPE